MTPALEMTVRLLLAVLVTLAAPAARAQEYEEEEGPPPLEGSSRFSLQSGWRYAPNTRFYEDYYTRRENRGLPRERGSIGGPLVTATFAYSPTDLIEVGIDLFATYERMRLTRLPGVNAVTFGALLGLRFQTRLEWGPEGLIPFAGLVGGPLLAAGFHDGGRSVESLNQAFGAAVGATLRLTPEWGLCAEFRMLHARGEVEDVGIYQAGGSWLSFGMTYNFPLVDDRPLNRRF